MQDKNLVVAVGVVCVTAIEMMALYQRVDGQYLSVVVGAIVGLIGLAFGIKIGSKETVPSVKES